MLYIHIGHKSQPVTCMRDANLIACEFIWSESSFISFDHRTTALHLADRSKCMNHAVRESYAHRADPRSLSIHDQTFIIYYFDGRQVRRIIKGNRMCKHKWIWKQGGYMHVCIHACSMYAYMHVCIRACMHTRFS